MPKTAMKRKLHDRQAGLDALSPGELPEEVELYDTDRILPKAEGGTYADLDNVRAVNPRPHMARHGNLREREESLERLKAMFDDRVQVMRLSLKMNNQVLAYKRRTDHLNADTLEFLEDQMGPIRKRLGRLDRQLGKAIGEHPDTLAQIALAVPYLGPITVAALTVYVDLAKASTPSSLWKYVGIHCASHERYVKGEKGGGNKTLRTVLYNTACVMMKARDSAYREVYDRVKTRLAQSDKVVKSRNTEGHMVEVPWSQAKPSHRHGAALRAVTKHVLSDYWYVGRTVAGLSTRSPYAHAMLGHEHMISPSERGWTY